MRYYEIVISDATSGKPIKTYSSLLANGQNNSGALTVEMDIPLYAMASPMGAAYLKLWGIGLQDIAQGSKLNGQSIRVSAGMSKGLPLANPAQSGLVLEGTIFQAYGNWQGENQSLDIVCYPYAGTIGNTANLVLNWKAGMPLGTAIANTLAVAFPQYKTTINISPKLVLSHDEPGFYGTLVQFAQYVKQVSQTIVGGTYSGVSMLVKNNQIIVYDGTTTSTPKQLVFTDMIGQPTWIGPQTINVRLVMRGDISVGDYVKLPPGSVTITTQASQPQARNSSAQQGVFQVTVVRHIGNSRQADANSWVTSIDAVIPA